jgi:hypothetical protein
VVEYLRVFHHVGFFVFGVAPTAATTEGGCRPISKGRLIMYIGGGLVTLVLVVLVILFVLRR